MVSVYSCYGDNGTSRASQWVYLCPQPVSKVPTIQLEQADHVTLFFEICPWSPALPCCPPSPRTSVGNVFSLPCHFPPLLTLLICHWNFKHGLPWGDFRSPNSSASAPPTPTASSSSHSILFRLYHATLLIMSVLIPPSSGAPPPDEKVAIMAFISGPPAWSTEPAESAYLVTICLRIKLRNERVMWPEVTQLSKWHSRIQPELCWTPKATTVSPNHLEVLRPPATPEESHAWGNSPGALDQFRPEWVGQRRPGGINASFLGVITWHLLYQGTFPRKSISGAC